MGFHGSRNAYLSEIINAVEEQEDIYLVTADLAAPCLDGFREKYPDRYVSVGIAEQSLISIASGIALTGKKVIAYTSNPFPVLRAFDQIRNAVSLMNIPLTIVGVGAGFSIPEYGATHFTIEDMNILRVCPHLQIINVSDINMAYMAAKKTIENKKPMYVRFDKLVNDNEFELQKADWENGFRILCGKGKYCIITTGIFSLELNSLLKKMDREDISLIDIFKLPLNEKELVKELKKYERVLTVEELCLQGGIGSVILETMCSNDCLKPIKRLGIDYKSGYPEQYGSREWHLNRNGLDEENLIKKINMYFERS